MAIVPNVAKKIGDTITFTYDFGDGWTFPIRLEEIIDDEVYEEASPLVLDGEGLGIIEDVGGVGAMSECVKAFEKSQVMIMKVILNGWESRIWTLLTLIKAP